MNPAGLISRNKSVLDFMETDPARDANLVERINRAIEEAAKGNAAETFDIDSVDHMTLEHRVPIQMGKWRILPPEVERRPRTATKTPVDLTLSALHGFPKTISLLIKATFLQGIHRVQDETFQLLDIGFTLGNGRIVSRPLPNDRPGSAVLI